MNTENLPVGIDLFCGAGGMSLGFETAGFSVLAAVDSDPVHLRTHSINFPHCRTLLSDISILSGNELLARAGLRDRAIHVVFGGAPCQGFSLMGKRRLDDPRNSLLHHFARLITEIRPFYFVAENVEGLLKGKTVVFLESFVTSLQGAGYQVVLPVQILDSSSFGVPQSRRRVFILGAQMGLPLPQYPTSPSNRESNVTVWEAIGDIPDVDAFDYLLASDFFSGKLYYPSKYAAFLRNGHESFGCRGRSQGVGLNGLSGCTRTKHTAETTRRFAATEPGTYEPVSKFYRLKKDGLAPTLRAGTARCHGSFTAPRPIHPVYPRCITVREAARIHSFFDWFVFHPTKWHGFRQVGNAVPPLLARAVAEQVRKAFESWMRSGSYESKYY